MNEEIQGLNRREVLQAAAGAGALLLLPAASQAKDAAETPAKDTAKWTLLGKTSDFPLNTPTRAAIGDLALSVDRTSEKDVKAVSLKCTHRGCEVGWEAEKAHYACPCHGAQFGVDGKCLTGTRRTPAELLPALATAPARIKDGKVEADLTALIAAPAEPKADH